MKKVNQKKNIRTISTHTKTLDAICRRNVEQEILVMYFFHEQQSSIGENKNTMAQTLSGIQLMRYLNTDTIEYKYLSLSTLKLHILGSLKN
jgi:hypothetical protein